MKKNKFFFNLFFFKFIFFSKKSYTVFIHSSPVSFTHLALKS